MYDLSRTVRFCVNLAPQNGDGGHRIHNSFGGWPSMSGFGAYYELDVRCRGGADPVTGYLMNISEIDKVVRQHAIPLFEETIRHRPQTAPGMLLSQLVRILQQSLNDTVRSVRLRLTPYYSVAMRTRSPDEVEIRQQFEFSASHRLHVASMTDQRNREVFGKCNNPNSHGHNYRIEVAVAVPLESIGVPSKPVMSLPELEAIVDGTIIHRFDHKHLNLDTNEFAMLNPSVENIAKVCHDLLRDPIAKAGGTLAHVTVWETEKTNCRYPAGGDE